MQIYDLVTSPLSAILLNPHQIYLCITSDASICQIADASEWVGIQVNFEPITSVALFAPLQ